MAVRVSPVSRFAAILIMALGVFTLIAGVVADVAANVVAGVAFTILGVALYLLLYRFSRRVRGELEKAAREG